MVDLWVDLEDIPNVGDVEFPELLPITQVDLVGPGAANRQHISMRTRVNTIRDRVNDIIAIMEAMQDSTVWPFVPQDKSTGFTNNAVALDIYGQLRNVATATAALDAVNLSQMDTAIAAANVDVEADITALEIALAALDARVAVLEAASGVVGGATEYSYQHPPILGERLSGGAVQGVVPYEPGPLHFVSLADKLSAIRTAGAGRSYAPLYVKLYYTGGSTIGTASEPRMRFNTVDAIAGCRYFYGGLYFQQPLLDEGFYYGFDTADNSSYPDARIVFQLTTLGFVWN